MTVSRTRRTKCGFLEQLVRQPRVLGPGVDHHIRNRHGWPIYGQLLQLAADGKRTHGPGAIR